MPANDSWMYQGRQEHGEFGHGTSPKTDNGSEHAVGASLFQPQNAGQRVGYVAGSIVGHAPSAQRSRWTTSAHDGAVEHLKTAVAAWYGSAKLSRDAFRDRFLDPSASDATVDALRNAARGAVDGRSYDDLARAGNELAGVALGLGPDRWPRFIGAAARSAVAAVDAGSVPGVMRASAADTGGALLTLGLLGVLTAVLSNRPSTQPSPPATIPSVAENRRPPQDAKDPNGAKAPGKPGAAEGFEDPKGGEQWVQNPNGRGFGWLDAKGNVWIPTGPQEGSPHGLPHWDVQKPGGRYQNIWPGNSLEPW